MYFCAALAALAQNGGQKQPLEVFYKKSALKNFAKFTGKYLCLRLYFNEVAGLSPETLLKKRLLHRCFFVNFVKFLSTSFFPEHLRTTAWGKHFVLFKSIANKGNREEHKTEMSGDHYLL